MFSGLITCVCTTAHTSQQHHCAHSLLFSVAFSQHDWWNDYFHFCLCWQRWQKDYILVEGKGETDPEGQIRSFVNQITCFGILSSSKSSSHGFGWCSVVLYPAFRQVPMIHSCSSSSKRDIKKCQLSPCPTCFLHHWGAAQISNFAFEKSIPF